MRMMSTTNASVTTIGEFYQNPYGKGFAQIAVLGPQVHEGSKVLDSC